MSEPLHESAEVSWLSFLDRFDSVMWPTLFAGRGYTKGEALIAWSISRLEETLEELKEEVRELHQ